MCRLHIPQFYDSNQDTKRHNTFQSKQLVLEAFFWVLKCLKTQ